MRFHVNIREEKLLSVPMRWWQQYPAHRADPDKLAIGARLDELAKGGTLTRENIDSAIGNNSWTSNTCDLCLRDFDVLILISEPEEPDEMKVQICRQCMNQATALIEFVESGCGVSRGVSRGSTGGNDASD